jgi:sugar phosphate isomerase/epimerase
MAISIGVQLYSVRDDCAKDFPAVLAAIAKMGYQGVEFAGYWGKSAKELRKMLADLGLQCCGAHVAIDTLLDHELPRTAEFHKDLGNPYLIVPGLPEKMRSTLDAWRSTAATFNEIARRLKSFGLHTGYHNHAIEFKPLDPLDPLHPTGQLPWDIFFSNTTPDVIMQFDTGNALHGGGEASHFLAKYPGRATTVHLKEFSTTNPNALIGEGDVKWKEIFHLCQTTGKTQWYIVEQESYAFPPLQCIELCLKNLRGILTN